ncbi:hypothetical protein L1283_003636 [Sphingobacterium sp. HSC-15S19]
MEILFLIGGILILFTYLLTIYRISKSSERIQLWKLLLIVFIPFWGCLVYLLSSNNLKRI